MQLKRVLPFLFILLTATACFRPADDSFDTVDSEGAQVIPSETPLAEVTVIAPGSTVSSQDAEAAEDESELAADPATETPIATIRIIESTNTPVPPPPTEESDGGTVPTATQLSVITPQTAPNQLAIETATPSVEETEVVVAPSGLQATPTEIGAATRSECEYIVQSGDNAFRIALNNNVSLDDLLAVNGLPQEPILQVGQVLVIPGCEEGASEDVVPTSDSDVTGDDTGEETTTSASGEIIHVVSSGETLLTIARQYGITVNDIVNANNLANPNVLDVGQELIIPQLDEEAEDE
jgi:LysM repeat protein